MSLPSVRQLECVVAVAEAGSFRGGAAGLGLSQPALSAQIAQLERQLGLQIFERDRRRVLVTPAGEDVVSRARRILAELAQLVEAAGAHRAPLTGTLRLGVIPTVAPYLLPLVLPAVRARYPRLRLVLREDQTARILAELEAGRLDACLLATPVPGDLATLELFREEFLLAAPLGHPLLARRRVREADLAGETTLLLEDGHCLRDQALAVCHSAGAHEAAELRATSLPTLTQMVASGLGVTLLPKLASEVLVPGPRAGVGLARIAERPGRTLGLVWRMSSARGRELRLLADAILAATPRAALAP
jgi:LysR family transcriptional regulator, hydrogen peroxide-inducible genes activator